MAHANRKARRRQTDYKVYLDWLFEDQHFEESVRKYITDALQELDKSYGSALSLPLVQDKTKQIEVLFNTGTNAYVDKNYGGFNSKNGFITLTREEIAFNVFTTEPRFTFSIEDARAMALLAYHNKDMLKNGIVLSGSPEEVKLLRDAIEEINGIQPPELQLTIRTERTPSPDSMPQEPAPEHGISPVSTMELRNADDAPKDDNTEETPEFIAEEYPDKKPVNPEPRVKCPTNTCRTCITTPCTTTFNKGKDHGNIIWASKGYDYPVNVIDLPKERGPNGKLYAEIESDDIRRFVPLDELKHNPSKQATTVPCWQSWKIAAMDLKNPTGFDEKEGLNVFLSKARAPAYLRADIEEAHMSPPMKLEY